MHIAPDHPAFTGHFPGQPLLPGVLLLSYVIESALSQPALAALLGEAPSIAHAKFLSPVRPGDTLSVELFAEARGLRFEVRCADRLAASGQFAAAATEAAGLKGPTATASTTAITGNSAGRTDVAGTAAP